MSGPRSAEDLADLVRAARARGDGLCVRGAGTWEEVLQRVPSVPVVDLAAFGGVHEYTPDDLTISVGAATTLAELDATTREAGQWCPLLPWGDDRGTVGATVATATAGPFAHALGRPRDLVIGLEAVDGTERIMRAGGRVVKNVAGFDLVRLMTGQWGTLAIITAVHLRLRARPVADETVLLTPRDHRPVERIALSSFLRGPYAPLACVPAGAERWLLRLGGNAAFVRASLGALRELGQCEPVGAAAWDEVRRTQAPMPSLGAWRWDALSRRVKERFDPDGILNPGLLGDTLSPRREGAHA